MAWARISLDSLSSNRATGPSEASGMVSPRVVRSVRSPPDHEHLVEGGHADEGDLAQDVLELALRRCRAQSATSASVGVRSSVASSEA